MNARNHILEACDLIEEAKERVPMLSVESRRLGKALEHLKKALEIETRAALLDADDDGGPRGPGPSA